MSKLKLGMISFAHGHAFGFLQELLQLPGVEVTAIADEVRSRVEETVNRLGVAYYEDYQDLLASDVDAVIVCAENTRHAQLTIDAANAKKHILCEKPLGVTVEEMERMVAACRENNVQLATAFPCRYLSAVARAKEAVDRGEIGDIVAIKGLNRGRMPGGWFVDPALSGGGALLDHTVHVMDLMNWFTGSRVTEVYAYAATRFHEHLDVEDTGMVHVKFASGAFGVIDTSWSRARSFPAGADVMMEIVGTQGNISVDALAQVNEVYSEETGTGVHEFWGDNMNELLLTAWIDAIRSGKPVPISGEDGLRSAEVAIAAYESVKLGQPVAVK